MVIRVVVAHFLASCGSSHLRGSTSETHTPFSKKILYYENSKNPFPPNIAFSVSSVCLCLSARLSSDSPLLSVFGLFRFPFLLLLLLQLCSFHFLRLYPPYQHLIFFNRWLFLYDNNILVRTSPRSPQSPFFPSPTSLIRNQFYARFHTVSRLNR